MTKVETERENCIDALLLAQKGADEGMVYAQMDKGLDSLISAVDADAFARGVAEGAEREAAKIVHCRECQFGLPDSNPNDYGRVCIEAAGYRREVDANDYCLFGVRDPTPVLAPTKEKP